MIRRFRQRLRGSIALVALCCVTVLGIALASYFNLSNQSMRLSNRSYALGVSAQLAEMGLEEALRAFNTNNFSGWTSGTSPNQTAVNWTISGTTATATISLPATKYGAGGLIGSVKLRVDNYDAFQQSSNWNSSTAYLVDNLVSRSGVWYRCILAHTNQPPVAPTSASTSTAGFWVQEQMPLAVSWSADTTYNAQAVVFYNSAWYRCVLSNTNQPPPNATYWTLITVITTVTATASANNESLLNYWSGSTWAWWRYNGGWDSSPAVSWRWRSSYAYGIDDMVDYNGIWYRCILAHTSTTTVPSANATRWSSAVPSSLWAWSAAPAYKLNDVVFNAGMWYRCILAHTNQAPPNAVYWTGAPRLPVSWDSKLNYPINKTVYYNGVWYRCLAANAGANPLTSASSWASTANSSYQWSAATAYAINSYASYGGVWYQCILAHTNKTPNNLTYWTALGAPVMYAEASVTLPDGTSTIKTLLRATVAPAPLFPNAIAASSALSISGAGTVDSYDSTQGAYGSPNLGYSATLAGGNTAGTAVSIANTTVKGYVAAPSAATAPYAPQWSYGGSAVLTGGAATGVDLTRVSRSPYIPQFDPTSVAGGNALALTSGVTTTIGISGATTPLVYYINGDLTRTNSDTLIINGPVILDVQGGITTTSGKILITSNGSAEIHFSGPLSVGSAGGGFDNRTYDPKKLILIGTATTTGAHSYASTQAFYGAIYMPYATNALTIGSGVVIYGALSAKNITFSGAAAVHYDTSLRYTTFGGVNAFYTIPEWRELTNAAERVAL